jgi:hypothetical protein
MSKFTDIIKSQSANSVAKNTVNRSKYAIYPIPKYNADQKNVSFNYWEYAYFPHLINLYNILNRNNDFLDYSEMYLFFKFLYQSSSGHIDTEKVMTPELEEIYNEYIIKRNNL